MDFDYDELLKEYSDDKPSKKESPAADDYEIRSFSEIQNERQRKVDDFKVNISSSDGEERPAQNKGVYFSNPPRNIQNTVRKETAKNTTDKKLAVCAPPTTEKQRKLMALKKAKDEQRSNTFWGKLFTSDKLSRTALTFAIIVFFSVIFCVYGVGCINDILALDEKEDSFVDVTVSENMTDSEVIDILGDEDLINNELFCKLFVKLLDITGDGTKRSYVSGVYTLNKKDGLEKMLSTMKAEITLYETVSLTFPEGWTIDQIAEKLEANEVCTAASFINTLQTIDFSEDYDFLKAIPNKDRRFRTLEGYMYPDTYEFYKGENASSVVRRFLDNFENRWSDEYQKLADERGVSIDEVIVMASVIQKEAGSNDQMADISKVLYNRLARPSSFPFIECDSTMDYYTATILPTLTSSTEDVEKRIQFTYDYDTYEHRKGLPVGAIANPGDAAIRAALKPSDVSYLFFCHNTETGKVYYANTDAEHEANKREAGLY